MKRVRNFSAVAAVVLSGVVLASCGGGTGSKNATAGAGNSTGFSAIVKQAHGQTVRWWLYGGDDKVNAYVDDVVAPAARKLGVQIRRVPVTDTADALQRVVAERRAGKTSGGAVDLIWLNGENFATGKQAGLWLRDWARGLPNARRYVDQGDPAISHDFQVSVDGQESPWQRAAFVYAYDTAKLKAPPQDLDALLAYAKAHPGRVTYPAPPDFTGSAFVRQVVAARGGDAAFAYLKELKPYLYRHGTTYPKSEAELSTLFGDGKVDFAMSYDSSFVSSGVRKGEFPGSARPFLLGGGSLQNTSFVTIPANAAHQAGAQVVANLLLSLELQAAKLAPASLGNPTVLDPRRLGASGRRLLGAAAASRYVLRDYGRTVPELPAGRVAPLERRWRQEILR